MTVEVQIAELIEPSLIGMGFELVRVQFAQGTLQVMAEKADFSTMTVDDCADISHTVSALLDVADPISSNYMLEVSSPGMDRPLVRLSDYERFSGLAAKIEMKLLVNGRKKYQGILRGANGTNIRLDVDEDTQVELAFADVQMAKLDGAKNMAKPQPKRKPAKAKAKSNAKKAQD